MIHNPTLDALTAGWKEIEQTATEIGLGFTPEDQPFAVQRYGGSMRLLYNGRPVCECKVVEKIEAVDEFPRFLAAYRDRLDTIEREAADKLANLVRYAEQFKQLRQRKP